jgi:monoterpene epsilon-lactone hydrolase
MFQLSFDINPDACRAVEEITSFIAYATTEAEDEVSA